MIWLHGECVENVADNYGHKSGNRFNISSFVSLDKFTSYLIESIIFKELLASKILSLLFNCKIIPTINLISRKSVTHQGKVIVSSNITQQPYLILFYIRQCRMTNYCSYEIRKCKLVDLYNSLLTTTYLKIHRYE